MSYAGPAKAKSMQSNTIRRLPTAAKPSDDADRTTVFAAGIVVGLVIGAGAALLFAPHSGKATRRKIARRGRRLGRKGRGKWDDLRDELRAARERRRLEHELE